MKHAIFSSRVVTPNDIIAATVFVDDGKIVGVEQCEPGSQHEIPSGINFVDAGELVVSPGAIDTHVHINEPGTDWEGFETATRAAAAGGVTTLIDMPLNSIPVTTTASALRSKQTAAQGKCCVDVGFYAGLIPGNESELEALITNGVMGVKAFLCDSGLDEFPAANEKTLRAALPILKAHNVPLLAHAEIVSDLSENQSASDVRSYRQYVASRPPEFELAAIELLLKLCREYQTPIHIVHLATAKALPMIVAAKQDGLPLTVETCPHYLFFDDTDIDDGRTEFKCAPPIRDVANRMLLCEAVAEGIIDTIGSDHSPCPPELKQLEHGDLSRAWGGIASLQLTLPAVWTVGRKLDWGLKLLAEKLSSKPAEIFGMRDSGRIEVGCNADFMIWNPDDSFLVHGHSLHHRHETTAYEGRLLDGVVRQTWLRGRKIFDVEEVENQFTAENSGTFLKRETSVVVSDCEIANYLNALTPVDKLSALETCCAATAWIDAMLAGSSFVDDGELMRRVESNWCGLAEADYLQAFSAHPKIGDVDSLREKYCNTRQIASNEQSGVVSASTETLKRLAAANEEYFKKFGFIFIVFATGKTADQMLQILESRLPNDRETEIRNAADAQLQITKLRLRNLPGN